MSLNSTAASDVSLVKVETAQEACAPSPLPPPYPAEMTLVPLSRNPLRLEEATLSTVLGRALPPYAVRSGESTVPRVSIVVVTYNNLVFTRMCLESALAATADVAYEIVVVDNASTDGTLEYLARLSEHDDRVHVLRNAENLGFAAANNRAVAAARGDSIVLLNNDTIVPRGWLTGLFRHLEDPRIGLVGPITNRIGNEAEVETTYRTFGQFERFAAETMCRNRGRQLDIRTAAMFCVALRRTTWERIGPLDEQFGPGMFEDDDYSMRARESGLRVICTDDVFVHHFAGASFGHLAAAGEYGTLFHANRRRWEIKWDRAWEPYRRRESARYRDLIERVRRTIEEHLPEGARLLVVSKGDDELLKLPRLHAEHFPRSPEGTYAGHNPADGREAVAHLESLRDQGARYLVFPNTSYWWLEFYVELNDYVTRNCRQIVHHDDGCAIYELP